MTDTADMSEPPSLHGQSWLERAEIQAVFCALASAGHEVRAVGGAVRNALMGRPVRDVDLATPARPGEIMRAAEAAGLKCIPTGVEHGTVTVVSGAVSYEVTTLREDVETDGRHAKVAFSTDWAADARRRDFTMNALYCAADGTVADPLIGYPDVMARRVVFVGDPRARIREDYLRILRFFRFHAEYGEGVPERAALDACVHERRGMTGLSAERVRAELLKLLEAPNALSAVRAMHEFGLLTAMLASAPRIGLFARLMEQESALQAGSDALLCLSVLAVSVEDDIARLADRLRLSNAERDMLLVVDSALVRIAERSDAEARRALYYAGTADWRRRILGVAAAGGATREVIHRLLDMPRQWTIPRFPLRGADALALGMEPGPDVGRILQDIETWWVDNDFAADETALRTRLAQMIRAR